MTLSSSSSIPFIISFLSIFSTGHAARLPFLVDNVSGIRDNLYSSNYYYLTSLLPYFSTAWEAECFKKNYGYLTFSENHAKAYLVIEVSDAESWVCEDYYEFKVESKTIVKESIFSSKDPHEIVFDTSDDKLRKEIMECGVSIYLYKNSLREWEESREEPSAKSTEDLTELMIEEDNNKSAGDSDNGVYKHENVADFKRETVTT